MGQVSLFVLLSIVFLLLVVIFIFLQLSVIEKTVSTEVTSTLSLSQAHHTAQNLVQLCLSELSDQIIYDAGEHAGYAIIENDFFRGLPFADGWGSEDHPEYMPLVYLKCGNARLLPTVSDIQRTIENALEFYLAYGNCLKNFDTLKKEGWNIEGTKIDATVTVQQTGVFIDLYFPRTATKDEFSFDIDTFHYNSQINFPFYLEKTEEIIQNITNILGDLKSRIGKETINGIRIKVYQFLDDFKIELSSTNHDLFHLPSLDPPPECSPHTEIFMIKNRENNFRFIFGASL